MMATAQGGAAEFQNTGGPWGIFDHKASPSEKFNQLIEYKCWSCSARSCQLKVCGLCQKAKYCDKECQARDWKEHCKTCNKEGSDLSDFCRGGSFTEVDVECLENESPEVFFACLDKCVKNGHNNHTGFIGICDLTLNHLPAPLRRWDVFEYIKAEADLTVRLKVKFTSCKRPDSDPCAQQRGTRCVRSGSGFFLLDNPDWFTKEPCPVLNCHRNEDLGPNHLIYKGDLKIFTNKHVVFDEDESAQTTVAFFYNDEDKTGVVEEYAINLYYLNGASDKAFVKVTVHDENMFKKLYDLDCERSDKFRKIPKDVIENWLPNAILISHPHGMPKKVSFGQVRDLIIENRNADTMENAKEACELQRKWFSSFQEEDYQKYMKFLSTKPLPVNKLFYDTPSCPGSSGGQVLFGGMALEGVPGPFIANHNGYDFDSTLNFFKCVKLCC